MKCQKLKRWEMIRLSRYVKIWEISKYVEKTFLNLYLIGISVDYMIVYFLS